MAHASVLVWVPPRDPVQTTQAALQQHYFSLNGLHAALDPAVGRGTISF
jgi:hypothetical protein